MTLKARRKQGNKRTKSLLTFVWLLLCFVFSPYVVTRAQMRPGLLNPKTIEPISAEEFRGLIAHHRGSVLVVNLWATWCVPCLKELPELAKLQEQYRQRGLKVITISMDDPSDIKKAKKVLLARAKVLTGYLQTEQEYDKFVSVIDPTWAEVMPTTFVIDREGKLKAKLSGGKSRDEFEAAIAPIL